jgi:endonuclease YncB( thermonuclease family)
MLRLLIAIAVLAAHLGLPMGAVASNGPVGEQAAPTAGVFVESVLDGDTVAIRGWRERVRLANIDAPEMSHGYGKPGQPYAVQATKWLTSAVEGKSGVTIHCVDEDRYGRKVCELFKDGTSLNKELVRVGLAWANTANRRYLRDRTVLDAQIEAREARRGLWSQPNPTPPWEWRHGCWERKVACD